MQLLNESSSTCYPSTRQRRAKHATVHRQLPLHHVKDNVDIAELLLQAHPRGILQTDSNRQTPLHCLVQDIGVVVVVPNRNTNAATTLDDDIAIFKSAHKSSSS